MENGALLRQILSLHWCEMAPLESKIFITLYWLAEPDSGEFSISLQRLSDKFHIPTNVLIQQLGRLLLRGLISFKSETNPTLDCHFKILFGKKPQTIHNQDELFAKVSEKTDESPPHVNDNVFNKNKIPLNGNDNVNVTRSEKKSESVPQDHRVELTARQLAKAMGDEKNIALYEAYLNRYSKEVILKAYNQVLQTPHERIKKSPGAYFTFLVRRYGNKAS